MKAILAYFDSSMQALEKGADIEKLVALPSRERIGRLKYAAEDVANSEYDATIAQMEKEIKDAVERSDD